MAESLSITIRSAVLGDSPDLSRIYGYYVEHTAISFEYDAPTAEEFRERIAHTLEKYPYLVAMADGRIAGYAYAGPLKTRKAYSHSCETSIYVDHEARRGGIGRALYEALEAELLKIGICNLYACITDPIEEDVYLTCDSRYFHMKMGYQLVGRFHRCGYKFGNWYNVIWMEKVIGKGGEKQELAEKTPDFAISVIRRLIASHITISTMESCTGGLLASAITDVSGASEIFRGGFVTYSNEAKVMQGVPRSVIALSGVYSKECAQAMAEACRKDYGAQIGVGVTGSLGRRDPANPDSVSGEVFYAIVYGEEAQSGHLHIPDSLTDRPAMKEYVIANIMADLGRILPQ